MAVNIAVWTAGCLILSTGDHLIHNYNQIKSYKWYPHQGPHCTDEVYNPRLHVDVLLSSITRLIVALAVRLIISSSSGLRLRRAPADPSEESLLVQDGQSVDQ